MIPDGFADRLANPFITIGLGGMRWYTGYTPGYTHNAARCNEPASFWTRKTSAVTALHPDAGLEAYILRTVSHPRGPKSAQGHTTLSIHLGVTL